MTRVVETESTWSPAATTEMERRIGRESHVRPIDGAAAIHGEGAIVVGGIREEAVEIGAENEVAGIAAEALRGGLRAVGEIGAKLEGNGAAERAAVQARAEADSAGHEIERLLFHRGRAKTNAEDGAGADGAAAGGGGVDVAIAAEEEGGLRIRAVFHRGAVVQLGQGGQDATGRHLEDGAIATRAAKAGDAVEIVVARLDERRVGKGALVRGAVIGELDERGDHTGGRHFENGAIAGGAAGGCAAVEKTIGGDREPGLRKRRSRPWVNR